MELSKVVLAWIWSEYRGYLHVKVSFGINEKWSTETIFLSGSFSGLLNKVPSEKFAINKVQVINHPLNHFSIH